MCQNKRYVNNRYIGRSVLVSCGRCSECLQEKANRRAARIRNHSADPSTGLCLFITLTYSNDYVPYIKLSDIETAKQKSIDSDYRDRIVLPLYRDTKIRGQKITKKTHKIGDIELNDIVDYDYFPPLRRKKNCFGVSWYDDVKRFMKRLRINLKRDINYDEKITYYSVSEYGGKFFRPHFHLLVYFPKGSLTEIRPLVVKSWPFGDLSKSSKRIQVPRNCSSYLAAYVNKSAGLPSICKANSLRSKFSHSKYFGLGLDCFSLTSILEKAERGDMCYRKQVLKDGVPLLVDVPMPDYAINRFFPRFKGDSLLSCAEVRSVLLCPITLWNKFGNWQGLTSYTKDEYCRFVNHLRKCIDYYIRITGKTEYDYVIDYQLVYNSRRSYVLRHQYDNVTDFGDFYFNANEFVYNPNIAPTLSLNRMYYVDYNSFPRDLAKGKLMSDLYYEKENQRVSTSLMLSELYDDM